MIMQEGALSQRVSIVLGAMVPWLPFIAICTLLSPIAAHLAQWGERRYGRGRLAAFIALVPVMPVILAIFLKPSILTFGPFLGVVSVWLLGEIWWQLLIIFLRHLVTFDYWAQLEQESEPRASDWLYEHRAYLEIKKTALIERKRRWDDMANDTPPIPSLEDSELQQESLTLGSPFADHWIRHWAIPLVIGCLFVGSALWQYLNRVSRPDTAITPEPPGLVFWYQALEPEDALLQNLVTAYNTLANTDDGRPMVQGCNQAGDFALEIYGAFLTGKTPDLMLVPAELAEQLSTSWGSDAARDNSTESTGFAEPLTGSWVPLWPDHLWRQRLALVIPPTTRLKQEAAAFADYLHSELSAY